MLGNTVDSSSSTVGTFVGQSFLKSVYSLDINNITFLIDLPVCGQRNKPMFSKSLQEHVLSVSSLAFVLVIG